MEDGPVVLTVSSTLENRMTNKQHIDWLVSACKLGATIYPTRKLRCTHNCIVNQGIQFVISRRCSRNILITMHNWRFARLGTQCQFTMRHADMKHFSITPGVSQCP